MAGIIIAWSFFSFIFFKVMIDAGLNSDITVLASLLMAIVFGGIVFFSSGVYAMKLFYINANPGSRSATLGEIIAKTIWPFLLFCAGFIISSRFIVFGFSKKLDREFSGYNGEEEFFWFCLFICIPLIVHYIMVLFPTYQNTAERFNKTKEME
ncbi:MAG: hypothetical protein CO093_01060 [Alphaproteobacteria bacterium CG_4_9_14_3_um_filter_47_13]|nr:MAG: hypothetical protein CO093_01060 [Alphaproteobacteria bacterium CG_4_9_14_3_um_filter_47_13]